MHHALPLTRAVTLLTALLLASVAHATAPATPMALEPDLASVDQQGLKQVSVPTHHSPYDGRVLPWPTHKAAAASTLPPICGLCGPAAAGLGVRGYLPCPPLAHGSATR